MCGILRFPLHPWDLHRDVPWGSVLRDATGFSLKTYIFFSILLDRRYKCAYLLRKGILFLAPHTCLWWSRDRYWNSTIWVQPHNFISVEGSCCPDIDSMASECFMWCIKYLMWYWTKNLALDWGGNTLVFIFLLLRQNSLTLWLSLIVLVCWNSNWISVAPVVYHCGIMDYMLQWGP